MRTTSFLSLFIFFHSCVSEGMNTFPRFFYSTFLFSLPFCQFTLNNGCVVRVLALQLYFLYIYFTFYVVCGLWLILCGVSLGYTTPHISWLLINSIVSFPSFLFLWSFPPFHVSTNAAWICVLSFLFGVHQLLSFSFAGTPLFLTKLSFPLTCFFACVDGFHSFGLFVLPYPFTWVVDSLCLVFRSLSFSSLFHFLFPFPLLFL